MSRGRGRNRHSNKATSIGIATVLLAAALTDAASSSCGLVVESPTPVVLAALLSDEASSSANFTIVNPTPVALVSAMTDQASTTGVVTIVAPPAVTLISAMTDEASTSAIVAVVVGGNDQFTMMLLHGDGTNGSFTIADSGFQNQNAFSNTNVVNDTSQKKFGTASLFFHTATGMNVTGNEPDIALGSGDFCVDFWIRFNNGAVFSNFNQTLFDFRPGVEGFYPYCELSGIAKWRWRSNNSFIINQPGSAVVALQWYHIAWIRLSNVLYLMQDGVQISSTADTSVYQQGSSRPFMGYTGSNQPFDGWIDEFRISKGASRFSPSGFTPPTQAYF